MEEDVIIYYVNSALIRIETDMGYSQTLSDYYSFFADNYQWNPKFKSKYWDGKIRLFNRNFGTLPAGLLDNLIEFLNESNKTFSLEGFPENLEKESIQKDFDRFLSKDIKLPDGYEIRDYQKSAVLDAILDKRNIILSPTGSGKSLIVYLYLRYCISRGISNRKILVMVPTINLVSQMISDFEDYSKLDTSFDSHKMCHMIMAGKEKDSSKRIYVSTWQSLANIKDKNYFTQFDICICDEVHTAEAKEISSIMEKLVNADRRTGLTGTLKELKCNPLQLIGHFGVIRKTKSTKELMDLNILTKTPVMAVVLKYEETTTKKYWDDIIGPLIKKKEQKKIYPAEMKFLATYKKRNNLIISLLKKLAGMNTLLLFRSVEHSKLIFDLLKSLNFDVHLMSSSLGVEEREAIRKYAETKNDVVIISTYQLFQLGINIKNLHNAIFCAPSKGRIRVMQSFGRLLRKAPDGRIGYLFDIIDDLRYKSKENITYSHGIKRLTYYQEEQLNIIYKAIDNV
jgi:superfamily II DNA or RNA helicase